MSLLLVVLVLSSSCYNWSTAADTSIICEAVRREAAEPSCQPVEDRGAPTTASVARYPNDESCAASVQSDGAKVMSSDGNYSISGLPNFSVNSSYVGYCPSDPIGDENGGCIKP